MKKQLKRKAMNLIELIGVMVVMSILLVIGAVSYNVTINNSKITTAEKALSNYEKTFESICSEYPGVIFDRESAWGDDGSAYTSKEGLKRLVNLMNERLDDELAFSWDNSLNCYVSIGQDPWGGNYILTEYPITSGYNFYDPTLRDIQSAEISIWASGINNYLITEQKVGKDDIGVALRYAKGDFTVNYYGTKGLDADDTLLDANITFK